MAEKGFGVKEVNLIGASGTPTITSPNNLNLNANNVAISTNVSIGGTLSVTGNISIGGTLTYEDVTNIDSVGLVTAREGIFIPDSKELKIGNTAGSPDLKIFHDGSNSYIKDDGTGELRLQSNIFAIQNTDGTNGAVFYGDGTSELMHNGSVKLATASGGVTVTGTLTATTFSGSGASLTSIPAANLTGTLPAISGANLTNLPASDPTNTDIQVVYYVTANGASAYRFAGNGVVSTADNPDLYFIRGQKYRFVNNSGGSHPFQIRESSGGTAYSTGVTNNGAASGNIDFAPTYDSPAQLVYQCTSHGGMVGNIYLRDAAGNNTNVGVVTATSFVPTAGQLSHRNIIVNGDMSVAQRGTQSTSDGIKTVDRFGIGFATGAIQQDQITLTSSDTPYAYGFRKSYRLTNTTPSTAVTAARDIRYQIEAQDIATSGWDSTSSSSEITISFWVKASVSQTYYVFHYVPDSQKNYNWNFTPAANTWTKITKTIPGASGVTINNDNGPGMSIQIVAYYGNNFTASTDPTQNQWFAWSGTNRIPNMTNTWGGTSNATFEVTGMQLEVGPVATPFEHRSRTENLARCQRYCVLKGGANGTYDAMATGAVWNSTLAFVPYFLPVEMRDTPSLTLVGSLSDFRYTRSGSEITPSGLTFDQGGKTMCAVRLTGSSMTQNDAVRLYNMTTDGGFLFTAEF